MSYRLLSYRSGREARAGILVGEQIYDAARLTAQPAWSSVLGALEDWGKAHRAFAAAAKARCALLQSCNAPRTEDHAGWPARRAAS